MSKNLEIKKQLVNETVSNFSDMPSTVIFNYSRFTSNEINELRRILHGQGAKLKIIKNTLIKRVFKKLNVSLEKDLDGQNAMLIPSKEDFMSSLKSIFDFIKRTDKGFISIGVLNGVVISGKQVEKLSRLPSRNELLGQVVSGLASPMRGFVYALTRKGYPGVGVTLF